jgi:GNAT superfamily N-acetyltransferase
VTVLAANQAGPLTQLLNSELGLGMYSEARLREDLADPDARVLGVADGAKLLAASVSRLLVAEDVDYYTAFGPAAVEVFARGPVGSFEAVAVDPQARRRGLGSDLLQASLRWMELRGCQEAVAVSWISGRASSAGLFARAGFTAGLTIRDFYLEESRRDGWTCPVCLGPCRCAGQFVHLHFPEAPG